MKFKKFASLCMASVMALAMAVPAFASSGTVGATGGQTVVDGEVKAPVIKVSVPTSADLVVNPYGLSVDVSADQDGSAMKTDQIIFATQYIKNLSQSNVKVSVSATGTTSDTKAITFATAPISTATKAPTTKQVFMYMEVVQNDDDTTEPTTWKSGFDAKANPNQVAIAAKAVSLNNVVTLAAANWSAYDSTDSDPDSTISAATTKGYAAITLKGDCAGDVPTAWTEADTVTVTLAYTFTPTSAAA